MFSKVIIPIYSPTNSVPKCFLLNMLPTCILSNLKFLLILVSVILIGKFLVITEVNHIFQCLMAVGNFFCTMPCFLFYMTVF